MSTILGLRVIIAGGETSIGPATAKLLGRHGAKVVVSDLSFKQAKQVAGEITSMGGAVTPAEFDLSQEQIIQGLINNGSRELEGLDGLITMGAALNPEHLGKDVPIGRRYIPQGFGCQLGRLCLHYQIRATAFYAQWLREHCYYVGSMNRKKNIRY